MWNVHEEWVERALCRGSAIRARSSDVFFPAHEKGDATRVAKDMCFACPVRLECLDYAIQNRIDYGIMGGMTAVEREKERLRRRRTRARVRSGLSDAAREIAEAIEVGV